MFDALRAHLGQLPILAELLEGAAIATPNHATNTEEQRFHLEQLHADLMARLRAEQQPYVVVYFPDQEEVDPIDQVLLKGAYWELNNPVTNQAICVPRKLIHGFVAHGQSHRVEAMRNVTGIRVGEMRSVLDLKAIARVLSGANVPPEVLAEAQAAVAQQAQELAQAKAPGAVAH